jgi:hypothetical protein
MREIGGLLLLALAVAVVAWGLWKFCGPRKRVRGIKIRLPEDEL